jgi:hypothetical protein
VTNLPWIPHAVPLGDDFHEQADGKIEGTKLEVAQSEKPLDSARDVKTIGDFHDQAGR